MIYTIIAIASFIQGAIGIGFGLLCIPFLIFIKSPQWAVPVILILSLFYNIGLWIGLRKHVRYNEMKWVTISGFIGLPLGTVALKVIPEIPFMFITGTCFAFIGFISLLELKFKTKKSTLGDIIAGFLSGILSTALGAGGSPLAIYFNGGVDNKDLFRANLAYFFTIINIVIIPLLWFSGFITQSLMIDACKLVLPTAIGGSIGFYYSPFLPKEKFRNTVMGIVILSGLWLIFQTLI